MDIFQVAGSIVCTHRHEGIAKLPLRLLKTPKGKYMVAVDTIGSRKGNWVYTISGSAARLALPDSSLITDLTIGGVIENWETEESTAVAKS